MRMTEAERKFLEVYGRMREKYGLNRRAYGSAFENEDDVVEVWRVNRKGERECVCKVKEERLEECYEKAADILELYDRWMSA